MRSVRNPQRMKDHSKAAPLPNISLRLLAKNLLYPIRNSKFVIRNYPQPPAFFTL